MRIERFNLAQQPMAFVENAAVKAFLEQNGQEALPLVFVDGKQMLAGRYPTRAELEAWNGGPIATLFTDQVAALVAIGAAIAANCELCFKYHHDLGRKLGITNADMRRAVDLAQKVKDTPARAMLELAARRLDDSDCGPAIAGADQAAAASSCCAPETELRMAALSGKCCEPGSQTGGFPTTACC